MNPNIPRALRSFFTNNAVQRMLGDNDPARLGQALAILRSPDDQIIGIDLVVLASCLQAAGVARVPIALSKAFDEALPVGELAAFLGSPKLQGLGDEGTWNDARTALTHGGSAYAVIAVARLQAALFHAEEEDRLKDHNDPSGNHNSNLARQARLERAAQARTREQQHNPSLATMKARPGPEAA